MSCCWWIFGHDWDKWERVRIRTIFYDIWTGEYLRTQINDDRMKRVCKKCGRIQFMKVRLP